MNKVLAGWILILLLPLAVSAGTISSSIACSGATWVQSSVIGPTMAYVAHLSATDNAIVNRNLGFGKSVSATVSGESAGPMGIDEYSGVVSNETVHGQECLFTGPVEKRERNDKISKTGLFLSGMYGSSQILDDEMKSNTIVNGTGIFLLHAHSYNGNKTISHVSNVAGEMNVTEKIEFGEISDD